MSCIYCMKLLLCKKFEVRQRMLQAIVHITGVNAIVQSFLLALFFSANKKGIRTRNRLLALLLLVFGVFIFSMLSGASYAFGRFYRASFLLRRTAFLIAPLFYFYVKSSVDPKFRVRRRDGLHFIPFAILFGSTVYQALVLGVWSYPPGKEYLFHSMAILIQNAVTIVLAVRYLRKRRISLKALFSKSDDANGRWLSFFILGYSVFWLINFHNLFLLKVLNVSTWCPYATSINCLIPFLFFNVIAFVALLKPEIFATQNRKGQTALHRSAAATYRRRLLTVMESQKPYLNPDLSMTDLARSISVSAKHLSYLINGVLHVNFYDFINRYRIEESKHLLADRSRPGKTILNIAYDVGFNSKSTFNQAFKKRTGMTPSGFRKTRRSQRKVEFSSGSYRLNSRTESEAQIT
jgi:AraC-like DNA-binding protein